MGQKDNTDLVKENNRGEGTTDMIFLVRRRSGT